MALTIYPGMRCARGKQRESVTEIKPAPMLRCVHNLLRLACLWARPRSKNTYRITMLWQDVDGLLLDVTLGRILFGKGK
jgi:hypothetical protein